MMQNIKSSLCVFAFMFKELFEGSHFRLGLFKICKTGEI